MPLAPAPLLPGTSPLPTPGRQPPTPRALRISVLLSLPLLLLALIGGQVLLPRILFLAPSLEARAGVAGIGQNAGNTFQGYLDTWTARDGSSLPQGGFDKPISLQNMQSQARDFHMNAVIIPVVADMPLRSEAGITWHSGEANNVDTLPEATYVKAITDARKAGLLPILELQMLLQDQNSANSSPDFIGETWAGSPSTAQIGGESGGVINIGPTEKAWFDNYTAFAVHYAQVSQKYHLPYFIIGDGLVSVTYDTDSTNASNDPDGIDRGVPSDPPCPKAATGRRECEWRHVVHALRVASYRQLSDHSKSQTGGGYTGKLIYAASWNSALEGKATFAEYDHIAWWDAVDYIGVDAFFALTQVDGAPTLSVLENAWHGQGGVPGQGDIYAHLENVSDTFHRPVLFTAAGYESVLGSNSQAFKQGDVSAANISQEEQANDMQALLATFAGTSWWAGVFWSADMPLDRSLQPHWDVGRNWAGQTLPTSKQSGKFLAQYYTDNPLPCSC